MEYRFWSDSCCSGDSRSCDRRRSKIERSKMGRMKIGGRSKIPMNMSWICKRGNKFLAKENKN
jgi:hypothetical protein